MRLLSSGSVSGKHMARILAKEITIGACLALLLGIFSYPRVRLLSSNATDVDAFTIDEEAFLSAVHSAREHAIDYLWLDVATTWLEPSTAARPLRILRTSSRVDRPGRIGSSLRGGRTCTTAFARRSPT